MILVGDTMGWTSNMILGHIVEFSIALIVMLVGALVFGFAVKKNPAIAAKLFYNILTGIIGGLIVVLFVNVQLNVALQTALAMLVIGVFVYILTPKKKK